MFQSSRRAPSRPLVRKDLLETTRLAVCESEGECPICREAYSVGKSIIRILPCQHSAHHQCIDLWFTRTTHVRCPLCMQTFAPPADSSTSLASDSSTSYSSLGLSVSSPNLLDRFQRGELLTTRGDSDFMRAAINAAAALEATAVEENEAKENRPGMFGPPNLFCRPLPPRLPAWLKKN